jgi:hypothetical protein
MVNVKQIDNFKEYGKCVSISNGKIEAIVTVEVGPRIVKYGFVDGVNFMRSDRSALENHDPLSKAHLEYYGDRPKYQTIGGHRIWVSPEYYPATYYPDNDPVKYEITENGAIFTPDEEKENGIQKQMEIKMDDSDTMSLTMRVTNTGKEDKEFAIWGLSVSEQNGTLIIPMNDNNTGLLSNRTLMLWPYTNLQDERLYLGSKFITLHQDVNAKGPLKIGLDLNKGKAYYVLDNDIFIKTFTPNHPDGTYPDNGCSFETYTDRSFLEVETLSELKSVKAGETVELSENWSVAKKPCEVDFKNDDSIAEFISKI